MTTGTAHFKSENAAVKYYETYGMDAGDVVGKIEDGEIFIGKPEARPGQRITLNDEGRYMIHEGVR